MPSTLNNETITAITTPLGEGAIGMIRISGEKALDALHQLFIFSHKNTEPKEFVPEPYKLQLGWILDPKTKKNIDQVMAVYMPAPHSFTGEDVVEFHAHGSRIILDEIIRLLLALGTIRLAEPGEFSRRAFLNGKMDLSQAESVIDLIRAQTTKSAQLAVEQLQGGLSRQIRSIYEDIMYVTGYLEATFDFVDDDVPPIPYDELEGKSSKARAALETLLSTARTGLLYKQGIKVVLLGFPNAGKSSLFNALLQYDRAIVTSTPGTTRDAIREYCDIDGIPVLLVDTAGIMKTEVEIDQESVRRSLQAIDSADIILVVFDSTDQKGSQQFLAELPDHVRELLAEKTALVVVNKVDEQDSAEAESFPQFTLFSFSQIAVSAKAGQGIEQLRSTIKHLATGEATSNTEDLLITNQRHQHNLEKALGYLREGEAGLLERREGDLVAVDLRSSLEALGEITGQVFTTELLHNVFGRFCIGK
ncbi:MAG: tRNA uridine-5-carboxymethylaminomethyl(34) synthesis GTPase MnmE [bacterium]